MGVVDRRGDDAVEPFPSTEEWIEAAYIRAEEPLNLAQLAERAARYIGSAARASRWLGAGSFVKAVTRERWGWNVGDV